MDSENRNTFKKKKKKNPQHLKKSVEGVDAECRKCTEQMLWTLDRVSSAGRDEWKHLNTDCAWAFSWQCCGGKKKVRRCTVPKIIHAFKRVFFSNKLITLITQSQGLLFSQECPVHAWAFLPTFPHWLGKSSKQACGCAAATA